MKLKAKVSLLAGALALAGVVYMPTAAAVLLTPPATLSIGPTTKAAAASFKDGYDFSVNHLATGNGSVSTSKTEVTFGAFTAGYGITLTSVELLTGGTNGTVIATGALTVSDGGGTSGPGFSVATTNYKSTLYFSPLAVGTTYTLAVLGSSLGGTPLPNYAGSFTVTPVPEPEEWAMMLLGAGLVSYQVRRKQKGLSQ
jgi:hypothetical protein